MVRHRELLAVLASGVSLGRLAVPLVAGMFGVSLLQLLNQEFVLHRVAPLVLRGHAEIGRGSMSSFPVRFVDDGRGSLWQSPAFDPATDTLGHPTILERGGQGRTARRIWAESATWDAQRGGWSLNRGAALSLPPPEALVGPTGGRQAIDFYPTDLDPRALTLHRYGEYAAMLSLRQIGQMLASERVSDAATLLRHRYARFAMVAVNLLVLLVCLPFLLLREPVSLMRQSLLCAGTAIPSLFGAALAMAVELPGVPPAVGVFLPVALLIPMAAGRWTMLRT
jgi:lipopolysaccharide export LptBFGC system permease protein LptF